MGVYLLKNKLLLMSEIKIGNMFKDANPENAPQFKAEPALHSKIKRKFFFVHNSNTTFNH